ncbi:uncharacterized protein METZ01_LOCUS242318, partial [marine metagenome]
VRFALGGQTKHAIVSLHSLTPVSRHVQHHTPIEVGQRCVAPRRLRLQIFAQAHRQHLHLGHGIDDHRIVAAPVGIFADVEERFNQTAGVVAWRCTSASLDHLLILGDPFPPATDGDEGSGTVSVEQRVVRILVVKILQIRESPKVIVFEDPVDLGQEIPCFGPG